MRKIQTINPVKYEENPAKGLKQQAGMITAGECFELLKNHLEETGLMPDEYFSLTWNVDEKMELPNYRKAVCSANWGSNEGIYLDVSLEYIEDHEIESMRIMVGKTLGTSGEDYMIMSRIAAECSLMSNGEGYIYKVPEESYQFSFTEKEKRQEIEKQKALQSKQKKTALQEGFLLSCTYETKYGTNTYISLHPDKETAREYVETIMQEEGYNEKNTGESFAFDVTPVVFNPARFSDYTGKTKALDQMIHAIDTEKKQNDKKEKQTKNIER